MIFVKKMFVEEWEKEVMALLWENRGRHLRYRQATTCYNRDLFHQRQIKSTLLHLLPHNHCCGAGAEEPKWNCLPETEQKLRIAALAEAPALFYLPQTWRNLTENWKISWLLKKFLSIVTFLNLVLKSKKVPVIFYKTFWSRSRNSDLRLRGAGSERNISAPHHHAHNISFAVKLIKCYDLRVPF